MSMLSILHTKLFIFLEWLTCLDGKISEFNSFFKFSGRKE